MYLYVFLGMSVLEVVAAHSVIQFLFVGTQNVIIFLYFYVVFYNPLFGSLTLVLFLVFTVEFCGMCYGMYNKHRGSNIFVNYLLPNI